MANTPPKRVLFNPESEQRNFHKDNIPSNVRRTVRNSVITKNQNGIPMPMTRRRLPGLSIRWQRSLTTPSGMPIRNKSFWNYLCCGGSTTNADPRCQTYTCPTNPPPENPVTTESVVPTVPPLNSASVLALSQVNEGDNVSSSTTVQPKPSESRRTPVTAAFPPYTGGYRRKLLKTRKLRKSRSKRTRTKK